MCVFGGMGAKSVFELAQRLKFKKRVIRVVTGCVAKLCACVKSTAQAFICANNLAPVLRRA